MVKDMMDFILTQDPEVGEAIKHEFDRQRRNIELIASENFVSEAVLAAAGSVLTNKYAEGYPSKRYYGGCQCVDVVENLARERACKPFGADHANVPPHSAVQCGRYRAGHGSGQRRTPDPWQSGQLLRQEL